MHLDHMVVLLSDLHRSIKFYNLLLPLMGFKKTADHVFCNEQGIHLDFRQASEAERGYHRYAPGLNHLGFTADSMEQLQSIISRLSHSGYDVPEIQDFEDASAVFLSDPDGMRLELAVYK